ncbi:hypothetical protein PPROV_000672000 [Pycnococcus provasolii]|uniref:Uncharacterized protein n=1 Tax=Pycnococcus provasolii TaxID=41880 RepID=A0A830HM73_9CHLO|nr:hypothetical protein PPROV_000672000 [Pycnococcus provasolii]
MGWQSPHELHCPYIAPTHCTPRADATRFYEDEADGILYVYEDTSFGERKVAGLLAFFNGGVIDMDPESSADSSDTSNALNACATSSVRSAILSHTHDHDTKTIATGGGTAGSIVTGYSPLRAHAAAWALAALACSRTVNFRRARIVNIMGEFATASALDKGPNSTSMAERPIWIPTNGITGAPLVAIVRIMTDPSPGPIPLRSLPISAAQRYDVHLALSGREAQSADEGLANIEQRP